MPSHFRLFRSISTNRTVRAWLLMSGSHFHVQDLRPQFVQVSVWRRLLKDVRQNQAEGSLRTTERYQDNLSLLVSRS